jgi:hypothetical protein
MSYQRMFFVGEHISGWVLNFEIYNPQEWAKDDNLIIEIKKGTGIIDLPESPSIVKLTVSPKFQHTANRENISGTLTQFRNIFTIFIRSYQISL